MTFNVRLCLLAYAIAIYPASYDYSFDSDNMNKYVDINGNLAGSSYKNYWDDHYYSYVFLVCNDSELMSLWEWRQMLP